MVRKFKLQNVDVDQANNKIVERYKILWLDERRKDNSEQTWKGQSCTSLAMFIASIDNDNKTSKSGYNLWEDWSKETNIGRALSWVSLRSIQTWHVIADHSNVTHWERRENGSKRVLREKSYVTNYSFGGYVNPIILPFPGSILMSIKLFLCNSPSMINPQVLSGMNLNSVPNTALP